MKDKREEAQICFKGICAKVYDENAQLINTIVVLTGFAILYSTIVKSLKN